jgi:DNA-binding winged helix-turn-helix (wHTH) protein
LRKLLEDDPHHPRYLQTVWGVGYVLIPDQDEKTDSRPVINPSAAPGKVIDAHEG